jgi:NADH dehydrogenase/NADH:ubiquinone oxidoreductase subunit G
MDCPIGARDDGLGHVSTVFPADLGLERRGACVRGLTAARLLHAPERILRGRKGDQDVSAEAAVQELVAVGSRYERSQTAVVVDVSRPLEGAVATAAFCADVGVRVALWAPPADLPLIRAGLRGCPPLAQVADCDLLLAVGDPFSTHPAIAHSARDMQFGARGRRLISVDTSFGRTARGATESLMVGPTKLAGFMAALAVECGAQEVASALGGRSAEDICGALNLDRERIASLAGRLKDADSVGVILSHNLGRYAAPSAVAGAVRELAGALNAPLWPLLLSANSAMLPRLKQRFGAVGAGQVIRDATAGRLKTLLLIGCDLASVLPERVWRPAVEACEVVGWAGPLEGPLAEAADVVVPLALPWEEDGTVLDTSGEPAAFPAWMDRPATALTVRELIEALARKAGTGMPHVASPAELARGEARGEPTADLIGEGILEAAELREGQALLVGAPEPQSYLGGLSLDCGHWQRRVMAEEKAIASTALAGELGVDESGVLTLFDGEERSVPCQALEGQGGAVIAVPEHWQVLRDMIEWGDGKLEPAPALVNVKPA